MWPVESDSSFSSLQERVAALILPGFAELPLSANTDAYCKWKLHSPGDRAPSKHPCRRRDRAAIQSELQASFDAR